MTKVLLQKRMHKLSRVFAMFVNGPLLSLLGAYVAYLAIAGWFGWESLLLLLLGGFVLGLGILDPVVEHRYVLIVADDFVEQTWWRKSRMTYVDVTEIEVGPVGQLTLKSGKKTFQTAGFVEDRQVVWKTIAEQLIKSGAKFKLSGNRAQRERLFGSSEK